MSISEFLGQVILKDYKLLVFYLQQITHLKSSFNIGPGLLVSVARVTGYSQTGCLLPKAKTCGRFQLLLSVQVCRIQSGLISIKIKNSPITFHHHLFHFKDEFISISVKLTRANTFQFLKNINENCCIRSNMTQLFLFF